MTTVAKSYDEILAELQANLSPQAAEGLLTFSFSGPQQQRMSELAAKARAGDLSESDRIEAQNYEQVSSLLGILQSQARMSLERSAS